MKPPRRPDGPRGTGGIRAIARMGRRRGRGRPALRLGARRLQHGQVSARHVYHLGADQRHRFPAKAAADPLPGCRATSAIASGEVFFGAWDAHSVVHFCSDCTSCLRLVAGLTAGGLLHVAVSRFRAICVRPLVVVVADYFGFDLRIFLRPCRSLPRRDSFLYLKDQYLRYVRADLSHRVFREILVNDLTSINAALSF